MRAMEDFRRMAAAMDHRVRQLEAEGVSRREWMNRMVGHLPDLHEIWIGANDGQLAELCREYPAFYHYASVMEDASQAMRANPAARRNDLPELPADLKEALSALLSNAATLESGYHTLTDAAGPAGDRVGLLPELNRLHRQWLLDQKSFFDFLNLKDRVPATARAFLVSAVGDIADRIARLKRRCLGI